eukprot:7207473-Pyramimonas_sp.AAC.1
MPLVRGKPQKLSLGLTSSAHSRFGLGHGRILEVRLQRARCQLGASRAEVVDKIGRLVSLGASAGRKGPTPAGPRGRGSAEGSIGPSWAMPTSRPLGP